MKPLPEYTSDSELVEIDIPLVMHILHRHLILMVCLVVVGISIGSGLALFFHQDQYRSTATLLFNPGPSSNIVGNVKVNDDFFKGSEPSSDPFKNQEELLKSKHLAQRVFKDLKRNKNIKGLTSLQQLGPRVLSAEHIRGTDFIEISVTWRNPEDAKKIAEAFITNYQALSSEISHEPLTNQKKSLALQVAKAETELSTLNQQLEQYEQAHGIVDLPAQEKIYVSQMDTLQGSYNDIESSLAAKEAEVERIKKQLQLDTQTAIAAVANGQNSIYSSLISKLNELEQDYNTKSLVFAPTNPVLMDMKEKMAVLKDQMGRMELQTVGRKFNMGNLLIMDDVRRELTRRLATLEGELSALKNRRQVSQKQLSNLQAMLESMPGKQINYERLVLEKKNKETIFNKLKENLAEVEIQETAIQKKVRVVDPPSSPKYPLFPTKLHLIFLSALLSCVIPTSSLVGYQYLKSCTARPLVLEKLLHIPVLAVIPWFAHDPWAVTMAGTPVGPPKGKTGQLLETAFQNLAFNIRNKAQQQHQNALMFAATYSDDIRYTVVLTQVARFLAQGGESVVLVDANLKNPKLHQTLGHNLQYEIGLTEVINELSDRLYQKPLMPLEEMTSIVDKCLLASDLHPRVQYINAGIKLDNAYEFLNAKGFAALIESLQSRFDWVLVDAPSLTQSLDGYLILNHMDALILLVERDASRLHLETVTRKVQQMDGTILGGVLRSLDDINPGNGDFFNA